MPKTEKKSNHIILASYSNLKYKETLPIKWGARTALERGPVVASVSNSKARNAIGTHSGSYTVYRALSIASGKFPTLHKPDLHNTQSPTQIGPYEQWFDSTKIVALDPWGLDPQLHFKSYFDQGYDIRPTIACTQAHLQIPELNQAIAAGRLKKDGKIIKDNGDISVYNKEWKNGSWNEAKGTAKCEADNSGQCWVKFNRFMPGGDYRVVSTDYTSYSIVYSCTEVLGWVAQENCWILAREAYEPGTAEHAEF